MRYCQGLTTTKINISDHANFMQSIFPEILWIQDKLKHNTFIGSLYELPSCCLQTDRQTHTDTHPSVDVEVLQNLKRLCVSYRVIMGDDEIRMVREPADTKYNQDGKEHVSNLKQGGII